MHFDSASRQVRLSPADSRYNFFQVNNVTYRALALDESDWRKGLGVNGSIFRVKVPGEPGPPMVVKICNFWDESTNGKAKSRRRRFCREIAAMRRAAKAGKENLIVTLKDQGRIMLPTKEPRQPITPRSPRQTHKCFLMEGADQNLSEFLSANVEITIQQRLLICYELVRAIKALHDIGVYHRDIKPQNVFLFGQQWKIGDLGLVAFRDEDTGYENRETIGPRYWMVPEALNRAFCIMRSDNGFVDRDIDDRSDVYQLGQLCWHILQGDIPNGWLKSSDLPCFGADLFGEILKPMLRYQRIERPGLKSIEDAFSPFLRKYIV